MSKCESIRSSIDSLLGSMEREVAPADTGTSFTLTADESLQQIEINNNICLYCDIPLGTQVGFATYVPRLPTAKVTVDPAADSVWLDGLPADPVRDFL